MVGNNITIGVRKPPPKAPGLRAGAQVSHSWHPLRTFDKVNCMLSSPILADVLLMDEDDEKTIKDPGVFFAYNNVSSRLQVLVRYVPLKSVHTLILEELGLLDEEPAIIIDDDEDFEVEAGCHFEATDVVFKITRLDPGYVYCLVVETQNGSFEVGSAATFTTAEPQVHLNNY